MYVVGATSLFLRAFYTFGSQYIYLDGEIAFLRRSAIKLGYLSGRGVPSVWLVNPRDSSHALQARTDETYSRRPLVRSISCRLIFRLVNTLSTQASLCLEVGHLGYSLCFSVIRSAWVKQVPVSLNFSLSISTLHPRNANKTLFCYQWDRSHQNGFFGFRHILLTTARDMNKNSDHENKTHHVWKTIARKKKYFWTRLPAQDKKEERTRLYKWTHDMDILTHCAIIIAYSCSIIE